MPYNLLFSRNLGAKYIGDVAIVNFFLDFWHNNGNVPYPKSTI